MDAIRTLMRNIFTEKLLMCDNSKAVHGRQVGLESPRRPRGRKMILPASGPSGATSSATARSNAPATDQEARHGKSKKKSVRTTRPKIAAIVTAEIRRGSRRRNGVLRTSPLYRRCMQFLCPHDRGSRDFPSSSKVREATPLVFSSRRTIRYRAGCGQAGPFAGNAGGRKAQRSAGGSNRCVRSISKDNTHACPAHQHQ